MQKHPYGLYVVLAIAVGFVLLHLDTTPLLFFAAIGLLSAGAGLFDSGDHTN